MTSGPVPSGRPARSVPPARSVDEVLALYRQWGPDHYDEELSQLDHALQTAALAEEEGASPELVAAALLHDAGHLLDLAGGALLDLAAGGDLDADLGHEATGARYLSVLFPPAVTGPIALHVRAKRHRGAVDPAYRATLSAGSTRSLVRQGGPLDDAEVRAFRRHPMHGDALRLREWDDRGKVEGLAVAPLEGHRALLDRLAAGRRTPA